MEEQGRQARWAQIQIEIERSQAQQGKKIEFKGQIERECRRGETFGWACWWALRRTVHSTSFIHALVQEKHFLCKRQEKQLMDQGFFYTCLSWETCKAFDWTALWMQASSVLPLLD